MSFNVTWVGWYFLVVLQQMLGTAIGQNCLEPRCGREPSPSYLLSSHKILPSLETRSEYMYA